ncbi:acetyltransferase [Limnohabitans sp. Rim8]|uniref:acetyltransferase n=1 Tax=Limnohabitans sp. Rim8 TaxID=1100718 RepID=UPI00262CE4F6|nr:acetyltransferase [Limnohabitans sp. Rim8]
MAKTRLLVVGAGGHGRSVAEAAELSGQFEVVGFLDDALPAGNSVLNVAVLGPMVSMGHHRAAADQTIVAIGNNAIREKLIQQLAATGFALATVVHPRAIVSSSAVLSEGSAVMAGAIVGTEARLGMGSIVNCGAVVDHHAIVEDFAHLGVNASMAGGTVLGRGAWMQAGAALGYGVTVPAGVTLAPGEAVDSKTNKYQND